MVRDNGKFDRSKLQDWPQVAHRCINKGFLEDRAVQGNLAGCFDRI